ncbi:DUF58 domain-containing protein [Marinomonas agarivorans]|nr:DUF58 domain-containing protein [Marinomonas agarivorans]
MTKQDFLQAPDSPELDVAELTKLAGFAKHLGKANLVPSHRIQNGSHRTHLRGHGMEMLEVRQYHSSDELRHIDWRVSARTGKTHTRVYTEEKEHSRLLVLSLSSNAYFGTTATFISTRIVQLMALIAWRTKQHNDKIGACLQFGPQMHFLPSKNTTNQLQALLTYLSQATHIKNRHHSSNDSVWSLLQKHTIKQQNMVICSDQSSLSTTELVQLRQLAKHNTVHWITIQDKRLAQLPTGMYQFEDPTGVYTIHASQSTIKNSQEKKRQVNRQLMQQLNNMGIHYHLFDLTESPIQIARHLLFRGVIS